MNETGFKALDISNYKANHNTNVNNDDGDLDDKTEDIFSSATNCIKDQKALGLFVDKLCYLLSSKRNYDINKNVVRAALTITEFIARVLSQMLKGTIALDGGSQNIGNSITDFTKWIWHFVDLNEETNHFVHYQPISWFLNEIYGL
ncbi:hypothetical protein H4219_003806 [Mycoemilia scoparia]|uniref:Uncharacterized protein n=1 Tax=Mycoemilia scoparia TaxID=417184 RepID=A0A9W7ZXX8_9FUNG|nr:hypothetical protein H4219_003806 [Mycoemilia scoparia]